MKIIRRLIAIIGILVIFNILNLSFNWETRDKLLEFQHQFFAPKDQVTTIREIDQVLASLTTLRFQDMSKEYLRFTKSNHSSYKKMVKRSTYYKVQRNDLNKKIVGDFRLKDFICKDRYYRNCILKKSDYVICIFDKKIFYKTLELLNAMEAANYDTDAIKIVNGHRHPKYNEAVKGARLSRHIKGEAVDITVKDINRDGRRNRTDKKLILELLDNKIIGNEGGIGLYPGTMNLHYDVRGYRARWNDY